MFTFLVSFQSKGPDSVMSRKVSWPAFRPQFFKSVLLMEICQIVRILFQYRASMEQDDSLRLFLFSNFTKELSAL